VYIFAKGNCTIQLDDFITDKPDLRCIHGIVNEIWNWDLPVDRVEVSRVVVERLGLPLAKTGEEYLVSFRWDVCPLPLPCPTKLILTNLPDGVFAIAHSDYPKEFPATCYLTDDARHNNRTKFIRG